MAEYRYFTLEQRKEIEKLHNEGVRTVEIAERIGRSVAAVYTELKRGYTQERNINKQQKYSADLAQTVFQNHIARRGRRRIAGNQLVKTER